MTTTTTTTKQSLARAKIRNLYYHFTDDIYIPLAIRELVSGRESYRDEALKIVDAWWNRCFARYRNSNSPHMDFVFAVAHYVRGDYDRSIHRSCVCDGETNGFGDVRKAYEYYRSRLAEAEALVGELVIDPPAEPFGAACACNVCVAKATA